MILVSGAVREEDIVFSGTGHTHIGGAQGSTLGLDALRVDEQSAENAAAVTLPAGGLLIVALPEMTVAVGDRVLVYALAIAIKGATDGATMIRVEQLAGTATGIFINDEVNITNSDHVLANNTARMILAGMYRITGAGTLTLRLLGFSTGSDSTIAIGDGDIHALVLRGTG